MSLAALPNNSGAAREGFIARVIAASRAEPADFCRREPGAMYTSQPMMGLMPALWAAR